MVVIIGAGLSGLLIGYRLKTQGIPFKILEARDRVGGRIHTVLGDDATPVEMGATWLGDQHIHLKDLLSELNLEYYEQYMQGTSFFQPFATAPASAFPVATQPPSYRIAGGSSSLIKVLTNKVGEENIALNEEVKCIRFSENSIDVIASNEYQASMLVLAVPPKLWSKNIDFSPSLPKELQGTASTTHTWMEGAIKAALTFKEPFWRHRGMSGTFFSNTGPITEFYDHCDVTEKKYALCGFASPSFESSSHDERQQLILNQLGNVFGRDLNAFIDYQERIWSREEYTYSADNTPLIPHQNNGHPIFQKGYFDNRLLISSSEASPVHAGYMEGAVVSANATAKKVKSYFANG